MGLGPEPIYSSYGPPPSHIPNGILNGLAQLMVVTNRQTNTHPFNGPLSRTTRVSRYQKGETNRDFTGARESERHCHQQGHMQVCTSHQTDNHTSTQPLSFLQAGCPSCHPTNSVKAQTDKRDKKDKRGDHSPDNVKFLSHWYDDWVKKCMEHEVGGSRPRGRPKKTWKEVVREDCLPRKLNKEDAIDRCKWRKVIKEVR